MAERPVDINLSNTNIPASNPDSPLHNRDAFRARLAQVLERGIIADRLHVELPSHLYGEWVSTDQIEIERKRAMGFEIDTEYAVKRALHNAGDGTARVGDVVFMVAPREVKELIDEIHLRKYLEMHDPKRFREEQQFKSQVKDLPTVDQSNVITVGEQQLLNQVKAGEIPTENVDSVKEGSRGSMRLDKPVPTTNTVVFKP